jgi:Recombinase
MMGEMAEHAPQIVTDNVTNNVTDNLTELRSLAGTPEYRAALVKEAQRLYAEGRSFEAIAQMWNVERIPTLSEKGRWHGKTLSRLI